MLDTNIRRFAHSHWPLALAVAASLAAVSPACADDPPAAPAPNEPAQPTPQWTEGTPIPQTIDLPDANKPAPAPTASAGESLTISADRPGFGDTTSITPPGHLLLEMGYTYTFRDREGTETQTHNGPELLARVGLIRDRLELRVSTSGYVWSRSNDGSGAGFDNVEGFSDVAIGARLKILDNSGLVPRLAFGASTTLGAGESDISNRKVEPTFRLIAAWNLTSRLTLTTNAGLSYTATSGSRFVQGFGSASLGYAASDNLALFVEYFLVGPRTKGGDTAHSIDFGGAYLLNKRVQLDARLGFGLNQEADNMFAGAGLSILF